MFNPDMDETAVKAIFKIAKDKLAVLQKSTITYESTPQIEKEKFKVLSTFN